MMPIASFDSFALTFKISTSREMQRTCATSLRIRDHGAPGVCCGASRHGRREFCGPSFDQFRGFCVSDSRSMFPHIARQWPRRPRLMRIAEVLGFLAGQRHEARFGLSCDRRPLAARALSSDAANRPKAASRSKQRWTV